MKCQVFCHWLLVAAYERAGALDIHETLYRWTRGANKELHSSYVSLSLGCYRGVEGKGREVLLVKNGRPLIAAHFALVGQL